VRTPRADFDTPWKEALDRYFRPFLAFFFPAAHDGIDWDSGVEFLEQELRQAVRVAGRGRHTVDKLAKVHLRSGEVAWLLIHVEIQSQRNGSFRRRTFVCNTILYSRHDCPVVSLVVLGDPVADLRPADFGYGRWGCEVGMRFPVVKLLDYEARWEELERSDNPFALLAMAHLRTQATTGKPESRLEWKLRLLNWLYEHHRDKEEVFLDLFRFLDWMMALPDDLEEQFEDTAERREEERRVPIISHLERKAIQRGMQQGMHEGGVRMAREAVLDNLEMRFERVPQSLAQKIERIEDPDLLRELRRKAWKVGSLDEFEQALPGGSE